MATRGRKPTPTAIKELEGNPGKRPLNEKEPKPAKKDNFDITQKHIWYGKLFF